ncbi:MAG TPA: hypothetical protein VKM55_11985 [Candidatus Lokiarchaeia archaeon]|nr:hypothetical protein [Candidatus Lokiarchaeia archaeon]
MGEKKGLSKNLIWNCFVNYVKTFEDAGGLLPTDDVPAKKPAAHEK